MYEAVVWVLLSASGHPVMAERFPDRTSCEQFRMQVERIQSRPQHRPHHQYNDRYSDRQTSGRYVERQSGPAVIQQGTTYQPYQQQYQQYRSEQPRYNSNHRPPSAYVQTNQYRCTQVRVLVN